MNLAAPQWVRESCRKWGRQKRRIWCGGERYEGDGWHVDGYAQSFLGRVQDERVAAGSGSAASISDRQHWPEVFWGEGLDVQRSLEALPETENRALHLHYVFDPEFGLLPRQKAAYIDLTANAYWLAVVQAELLIWRRLDPNAPREAVPVFVIPRRRRVRVSVNQSGISFEALGRSILGIRK